MGVVEHETGKVGGGKCQMPLILLLGAEYYSLSWAGSHG